MFVEHAVNFIHTCNKNPLVLVTAKHSSGEGNALPECNGIVSWIEVNIFITYYLTVILRGRAGYELIYITNEAVDRVGYYQLISGKSEKNNFRQFS